MLFPQELILPQRIIFKKNGFLDLAKETLEYGDNGIILHGRSFESHGKKEFLQKTFTRAQKVRFVPFSGKEPDLDDVSSLIKTAKEIKADWIAGIGGGSVLDLAKAAAGLYNAPGLPADYQNGAPLEALGIPFIAVPTTCGTGAEVTVNAVITNSSHKNKLSIRDKSFMARKVFLDVSLLAGLAPSVIAHSGMDAFVQAYESYISKGATWYSEEFSLKALKLINKNIVPAFETRKEEYLSDMLLGSFFAGVAFSSARLGVIHGIAHPLGFLYKFPHGLVCASCLLSSIEINRAHMGKKYDAMSSSLGSDLSTRVSEILSSLKLTSPFSGKTVLEKDLIIKETLSSGSTAANPKIITSQDVDFILSNIF